MRMVFRNFSLIFLGLSYAACLDPLVSDEINPARFYGDPEIPLDDFPHVEDDPAVQELKELYPTSIPYLKGYAGGHSIWYWEVPEPATNLIVDLYVVLENEKPINGPIIDVLPGDAGYSPLWRKVFLSTTELYQGERILSREGIEVAIQEGLLEAPFRSELVTNCPVVGRGAQIPLAANSTATASLIRGWYRNQQINLISFSPDLIVPVELNRIPIFPLYIFQRINETTPLSEPLIGVDEDGDNRLLTTNNIFAGNVADNFENRYSPIWQPWLVRTSSTYPSIDSGDGSPPAYKSETDFYDRARERLRDSARFDAEGGEGYVVSMEKLGGVVNCPIQAEEGSL